MKIGKLVCLLILVSFAIALGTWDGSAIAPEETGTCQVVTTKEWCDHSVLIGEDEDYWGVSFRNNKDEETLIHRCYKCSFCGKKIIIHTASAHKPSKFTEAEENALEAALKVLVDPNNK